MRETRANQLGVLQSVLGLDIESSSEDDDSEKAGEESSENEEREKKRTERKIAKTEEQKAIERRKRRDGARFLIVQKSKSSCNVIAELLRQWGFKSIATTSAFEALEALSPGINAEYSVMGPIREFEHTQPAEPPSLLIEDHEDTDSLAETSHMLAVPPSPPLFARTIAMSVGGEDSPPSLRGSEGSPVLTIRSRSNSFGRDHLLQAVSNEIEPIKEPPTTTQMIDPKERESASIKVIIVDYDLIGMNALQFGERVCYLNDRRSPNDKVKMILTVNVGVPLPKSAPAWGFGITSTSPLPLPPASFHQNNTLISFFIHSDEAVCRG